jgi:hypothetical protein
LSLWYKAHKEEFINACKMALDTGACNYFFMKNVLTNGSARNYQKAIELFIFHTPGHANIRGHNYYK